MSDPIPSAGLICYEEALSASGDDGDRMDITAIVLGEEHRCGIAIHDSVNVSVVCSGFVMQGNTRTAFSRMVLLGAADAWQDLITTATGQSAVISVSICSQAATATTFSFGVECDAI